MISSLDVAWAAGFLEGEGSFDCAGSPRVSAAQVQREPIDRLIRIFGGKATQRKTKGFGGNLIWVWRTSARRSVEIMMTVYSLMSPKRQDEIRVSLEKWKRGRLLKSHASDVCGRGHKLEGYNVLVVGRYKKCRQCKNDSRRLWRARKTARQNP